MTPDEETRRAERAAVLLDDPLVSEALDAIKGAALAQWETTAEHDTASRERLWLMARMADKFRAHLESHITTGKLASRQVVEQERRKLFGLVR